MKIQTAEEKRAAEDQALDEVRRLFNEELGARVMASLTGTRPEAWRVRVRRWFANKLKRVIVTTGEGK